MGAVHSLQARVFGDLLLVPIHSQIQSTIRGIIVLLAEPGKRRGAVIDKIGWELFEERGCAADKWQLLTNVSMLSRFVQCVEVIE